MKRTEALKKLSMYGVAYDVDDSLCLDTDWEGIKNAITIPDTPEEEFYVPFHGVGFDELSKHDQLAVLKIANEYAATPYEEREDHSYFKVVVVPLEQRPKYLHVTKNNRLTADTIEYGTCFTQDSYAELLDECSPAWKAVLHPYDDDNTTLFTPVNAKGRH